VALVAVVPEAIAVPAAAGVAEAPAARGPVVSVPALVVAVVVGNGGAAPGALVAAIVAPSVAADSATGPVNSGAGRRPTTPCASTATISSGTSPMAGTSHHQRQTGVAATRRERTA
jgi:hypothetical protein